MDTYEEAIKKIKSVRKMADGNMLLTLTQGAKEKKKHPEGPWDVKTKVLNGGKMKILQKYQVKNKELFGRRPPLTTDIFPNTRNYRCL